MAYDIIIRNGTVFDGSGGPGLRHDIGIRDGRIVASQAEPLDDTDCPRVVDARGCWVTPGFIEPHSHYDAEVIAAPELVESVRHGVTTVMTGICSISMVCAEAEDCSDLFTRVEAVPREQVLPLLRSKKSWNSPTDFRAFFDQHPLGPNLAAFVGHSDIRARVMGLERSVSGAKPSEAELQQMEALLEEALDAGFLGLSSMTTKLDRLDGERAWAKPLPATFASWHEYRRLNRILRRRGAILQSAPDAVGKINIFAFFWEALGWFRKALKTTLLTCLDLKSQPWMPVGTRLGAWIINTLGRANFRWQYLPAPFEVYAYGLDFNSFGELADARILRDVPNPDDMYAEADKPGFRDILRRNMSETLTVGLWHRDFSDGRVVECPEEPELVGQTFAQIGAKRGQDPIDAFLDLALQYRHKLRWGICFTAERTKVTRALIASPQVHVGFADSGAHLVNLASYNFPLCLLKHVRDAELAGESFMSTGAAVRRLTGELADWYDLDCGYIRIGDRADLVVINPEGLTEEVFGMTDAPFPAFGLTRLVNRNDAAVKATLINGRLAYSPEDGYAEDLGKQKLYGRFLAPRSAPKAPTDPVDNKPGQLAQAA